MNDAISRTALLRKTRPVQNLVVKRFGDEWQVEMVTLEDIIDAPALDVAPVVHARWEFGFTNYYCSHCDKKLRKMNKSSLPKYCERCGARMDGEAE